jgi:hypothetical protein
MRSQNISLERYRYINMLGIRVVTEHIDIAIASCEFSMKITLVSSVIFIENSQDAILLLD